MKRLKLLFLFIITCVSLQGYAYESESFRVMAWNVYMLPKPLKFSRQNERTQLQIEALRRLAQENDVLVLTEAFQARYLREVESALEEFYPYVSLHRRRGAIHRVMRSGVMILSKYPSRVLGHVTYSQCAKADCFAAKGALLVELTLSEGKRVQLLGTHLQSGSGERIESIRRSQLEQIKGLLDTFKEADVPQVLAGDFNIDSQRGPEFDELISFLELRELADHMRYESTKPELTECFGVEYKGVEKTIDHILVRPHQSSTELAEERVYPLQDFYSSNELCDLSDHHPVQSLIIVD
jgi:endonuclease/exonuclease/phosphatase family metal-dependent hydrolase